ncbi:hypothetical protein AGMMS50256_35640 [Betaproteobacteria bacterium]|nr:hypothetical protein AGMMS50256_35640 [Betaproteobacteria bacterium]
MSLLVSSNQDSLLALLCMVVDKVHSIYVAWALDLGVQGYAGKREGVLGSLKARYRF